MKKKKENIIPTPHHNPKVHMVKPCPSLTSSHSTHWLHFWTAATLAFCFWNMTKSVPTPRVSQFLVPLPGVFLPPDVYMAGSTFIFKRLSHDIASKQSSLTRFPSTYFPMYYLQSSYHCLKPSFFITVYYLTHPTRMWGTGRPEALVFLLTYTHSINLFLLNKHISLFWFSLLSLLLKNSKAPHCL